MKDAGGAAQAGFSALQRAENSSMRKERTAGERGKMFQCSSASRKFLNRCRAADAPGREEVSVLFSEPKIPQFRRVAQHLAALRGFSALQRAENSSIDDGA